MESFAGNLPEVVSQDFHKLKVSIAASQSAANIFTEASNTITETAKLPKDSFAEKIDQTKISLEGALGRAERLSNTAANAIQEAVNESINQQLEVAKTWVNSHPVVSWVIEVLLWGFNHPIIGLITMLLASSILWQLLKAFSRLIETVLLSILQAPLKLSHSLGKFSLKSLGQFKISGSTTLPPELSTVSKAASTVTTSQTKQEELARILARLEAINQEQNQLLKEVIVTLSADQQPH